MANPQPGEAHLRMAHSIAEQIMVSHFSEQQRRILDLILRLSWGCGKMTAFIPHQRDFRLVGIGENRIKNHLDWLQSAKVINRAGQFYSFNRQFDQWRVSRAFAYCPQKISELVGLNLKTGDIDISQDVTPETTDKEKSITAAHGLAEKGSSGLPEREAARREGMVSRLADKGSPNFPRREFTASLKGNSGEPESASPKEKLNKYINKNNQYINIFSGKVFDENAVSAREAGAVWERVLQRLAEQVSPANYRTWLAKTRGLGFLDADFLVGVPDGMAAEHLRANLRTLLESNLIEETRQDFRIHFLDMERDVRS
jgi:hypothetical protein